MSDDKWGSSPYKEDQWHDSREKKPVMVDGAPQTASQAVSPQQPDTTCFNHYDQQAQWICSQCGKVFCDECLEVKGDGIPNRGCQSCGAMCRKLETVQKKASSISLGADSFFSSLLSSFMYPLRGKGLVIMIVGTLVMFFFMLAMGILGLASPWLALGVLVTAAAYPCAFMMEVLSDSAHGYGQPDWPDLSSVFSGLVVPFAKFTGTFLISFLPVILFSIYSGRHLAELMMQEQIEKSAQQLTYSPPQTQAAVQRKPPAL